MCNIFFVIIILLWLLYLCSSCGRLWVLCVYGVPARRSCRWCGSGRRETRLSIEVIIFFLERINVFSSREMEHFRLCFFSFAFYVFFCCFILNTKHMLRVLRSSFFFENDFEFAFFEGQVIYTNVPAKIYLSKFCAYSIASFLVIESLSNKRDKICSRHIHLYLDRCLLP